MLSQTFSSVSPTVVLLAPGFNAQLITEITTQGRHAGRAVSLVGLMAGPLRSDVGIALLPDRTLDLVTLHEAIWVLIPGGRACVQALLRDPRVHRLCQEVWEKGGQVVAELGVAVLVQEAGVRLNAGGAGEPTPWFEEILKMTV